MPTKPAPPEAFRNTAYYRLLEFAYQRTTENKTFTERDALTATGLSEADFAELKTAVVSDPSVTDYAMEVKAFLDYAGFLELAHSRQAATQADSRAFWAQVTAVIAIVIAIGLGMVPIFFNPSMSLDAAQLKSLTGTKYVTELDPAQMTHLTAAIQAARLDPSQLKELLDRVAKIQAKVAPDGGAPRGTAAIGSGGKK